MTGSMRAIYFIAMERQAADRRHAEVDRRRLAGPDRPPGPLVDPGERRRAALGNLRRWFVASRTAEAF